jgi:hypothetical protein
VDALAHARVEGVAQLLAQGDIVSAAIFQKGVVLFFGADAPEEVGIGQIYVFKILEH